MGDVYKQRNLDECDVNNPKIYRCKLYKKCSNIKNKKTAWSLFEFGKSLQG